MAKFINKKEQVYDLKLTSYGHYLFAIGKFKPTYYAFYDDNVLYDGAYAVISESQNNIHKRVKDETQYLESVVLFRDVEDFVGLNAGEQVNFFTREITPSEHIPRKDIYVYGSAIGDAWLDGETQSAPAWKVVALQGMITSSTEFDIANNINIPQIDMTLEYKLKVREPDYLLTPDSVRELQATSLFIDNKVIALEYDDAVLYIDEVNTELLTKNFDIEVFHTVTGSTSGSIGTTLERKFFKRPPPQIQDGIMISETPIELSDEQINSGSVEYYFDILRDSQVDQGIACRGAEIFNKQSYYVDLDFDCDGIEGEDFFDIYGSATEPEICLD